MSFGVEPPLGKLKKCFVKFKMNLLVFTIKNKGFKGRLCNCPVRRGGTSLSPLAWLQPGAGPTRAGKGGELAPFQPSDQLSL